MLFVVSASAPLGNAATGASGSADAAVAPSVWVAASGQDTACRRGQASRPCATLTRAYQIARCGDHVSIAPGSYPSQALGHSTAGQNRDAKDCSAQRNPVVFRGQSRRSVSFDGI